MTKRLQVLLDESEIREIRRVARAQKMSVAEWVRQVLRSARRNQPIEDSAKKLQVIRAAARNRYPVRDVDQLLSEIESGYLKEPKS